MNTSHATPPRTLGYLLADALQEFLPEAEWQEGWERGRISTVWPAFQRLLLDGEVFATGSLDGVTVVRIDPQVVVELVPAAEWLRDPEEIRLRNRYPSMVPGAKALFRGEWLSPDELLRAREPGEGADEHPKWRVPPIVPREPGAPIHDARHEGTLQHRSRPDSQFTSVLFHRHRPLEPAVERLNRLSEALRALEGEEEQLRRAVEAGTVVIQLRDYDNPLVPSSPCPPELLRECELDPGAGLLVRREDKRRFWVTDVVVPMEEVAEANARAWFREQVKGEKRRSRDAYAAEAKDKFGCPPHRFKHRIWPKIAREAGWNKRGRPTG